MDAFTSDIFQGNPAAVVVMPPALYHKADVTQWMQKVAMENNLSETAYVARRQSANSAVAEYDLRWFTPRKSVLAYHFAGQSGSLTRDVVLCMNRGGGRALRPRDALGRARAVRRRPRASDLCDPLPHFVRPCIYPSALLRFAIYDSKAH